MKVIYSKGKKNEVRSIMQWDQKVYLQIAGLPSTDYLCDFWRTGLEKAQPVGIHDGTIDTFMIPNSWLLVAGEITVYLRHVDSDSMASEMVITITVTPRAQPDDFVLEDDVDFITMTGLIAQAQSTLDDTVTERVAAQTARIGAETAQIGSEAAKTGAETAQAGALAEKTGAEAAKAGAEAARDAASGFATASSESSIEATATLEEVQSHTGVAGGWAQLNDQGVIPSSQLPSFVDDVVEAATYSALPVSGETGKIYVTLDTSITYRWSGTVYVEISASLALGETDSTAYRGDRGKAAYNHSQSTGNPHNTSAADVGLGNVNNTSDADKPVSTAQQTALNGKQDKLTFDAAPTSGSGNPVTSGGVYTGLAAKADTPVALTFDGGEYTNIKQYLDAHRDGLPFITAAPVYDANQSTTCVKMGANAGLVSVPSTATTRGQDDYRRYNTFLCWRVNGWVDSSGVPHITAIEGFDSRFRVDGSNGNVWVLAPLLYWHIWSDSSWQYWGVSDVQHDGWNIQPGGQLASGVARPFILYAAYAGSQVNGLLASVSGKPLWNRNVSQNSLRTLFSATPQYSGMTSADQWYLQAMSIVKYATKSSQNVMAGCNSYSYQYAPVIAETGVNRVILTNAQAANLLVGSTVSLGTGAVGTDRGTATTYDVFDLRRITSITTYDANNKAVTIEGAAFNTTTTGCLSTMPYHSGYCDSVLGVDGSPISNTSGKEPFKLQGIECMVGTYEVLANVILNATTNAQSALIEEAYVCYNSGKYASSLTSDYVDTGISLPIAPADGWSYAQDLVFGADGLIIPKGYGATSSTGTGDAVYQNVSTSKGLREWLAFGYLDAGSRAGLSCVFGDYGLTGARWSFASRLSAIGLTSA